MEAINEQITENNKVIKSYEDEINKIKLDRSLLISSMNNSNAKYDEWDNAVLVCSKYDEFCRSLLPDKDTTDTLDTMIARLKVEYESINKQINDTKTTLQTAQKLRFEFESKLSKIKSLKINL